jgi:hypothetical protein
MKSVFSNKSSQVHLQRNAFDLSHSDVFSIAPGMLLPIHVSEVNPNEHFVISPANYVRTMPLNSAAFTRLKQHIEFYFVPMRTLCRQFNQFIVGTDYKISSLSSLNTYKSSLPTFDLVSTAIHLSSGVTDSSYTNAFGLPRRYDMLRLFDMLGYGLNSTNFKNFDSIKSTYLVNPFRFLAYQKVYFDYYRNPLYELNNPSSYNVDAFYGTTFSLDSSSTTLRYRNWNKDYFTSLSPSFQGADYLTSPVDMSSILNLTDNTNLKGHDFLPSTSSNLTWNGVSVPSGSSMVGSLSRPDNTGLVFNIANLRAAYALDKLYRISIAAGDGDYGSQIKAHYGFNAVHDDWKSQFIGGCSAPIQISEVITTATTTNSSGNLLATSGDIKGKGVSLNQGSFTFDSREHGIIIGILSIVPEADYQSSMVDRFNVKVNREDYFQPEFQDLGKQPISSSELSFSVYNKTVSSPSNPQKLIFNNIIGFTNRYMEYKTSVNKVHGSFISGGTLSAWASPRNNPLFVDTSYSALSISSTSLKVDPRILDPIMAVSYDGTESTDPFICDCHVSVQAVRPMSVSGEPML